MWQVEFDDRAAKELRKLNAQSQGDILAYLSKNVEGQNDPRLFGKALKGDKAGLWRYRVGNYRLIVQIEDKKFRVLVLRVGDRKNVYDQESENQRFPQFSLLLRSDSKILQ